MALAELQRAMRDALHHDRPEALITAIVPEAARTREAAVAVYANMYRARLLDSLREDFPGVADRLGQAFFERVALTHVRRCPSRHPSLAFLGRGFDETLEGLGLVEEAAVARVELAHNEAFWAPDAPTIDAPALGALGDDLGSAVLRLHPSLQIVVAPPSRAVWRRDDAVHELALTSLELAALSRARGGASVAEVFELFVDEDDPEAAALACLLAWVSRGWIVGARVA